MGQEPDQVEVPLPGEDPVVAGPGQHVHAQQRRVGQLHEEDLLRRDVLDRRRVPAPGEDVEAVQAGAHTGVVGEVHDPLGPLEVVDEPPPRERLVGQAHAVALGQLPEPAQLGGHELVVVDLGRGHVGAHEHGADAQPLHQPELGPGPAQVGGEPLRPHGVGVAEGLVEVQAQAEVRGEPADLLGGGGRDHEVLLEDLDPVEAGRGGGVQLLLEGSREADGGDGRPHQLALRGRAGPGGRAGGVTAGLIGPPVGWATRRTCRPSHIVEITSVV